MNAEPTIPKTTFPPGWQWEKTRIRFGPHNREQFAGEVLQVIAQSIRHEIPMLPALHALREGVGFMGLRFRDVKARETLRLFTADLEEGISLGEALVRRYADALPAYALEAIVRAEATDRLPALLPPLADLLGARDDVFLRCRTALFYPLVQFTTLLLVLAGLLVFIVPKFTRMLHHEMYSPAFREAVTGGPMWLLDSLSRYSACFLMPPGLVLGLAGFVILMISLLRRRRFFHELAGEIVRPLPVIGSMVGRLRAIELYSAMAAFLDAGMDIPAAAELGAGIMTSRRLRNALGQFVRETRSGASWLAAWEAAFRPEPLCLFLLRNAATRERPSRGFADAAAWLSRDLRRRVVVFTSWVEPASILLNAALVGLVVYAIGGSLFSFLYRSALSM